LAEAERELQELEKRVQQRTEFDLDEDGAATYSWEMALARRERVTARVEALQEALGRVHASTFYVVAFVKLLVDRRTGRTDPVRSFCLTR